MNQILIKNGTVINATETIVADVLIQNHTIAKIGKNITKPLPAIEIDANGKYIIPGGIDPHVHLSLPTPAGNSSDDFFTGSKAAIIGGTTSIIDFVTPSKGESLIKALKERKMAAKNSLCDYGLHLGITWWHSNLEKEIRYCIENEGINSFKTYLAYKGSIGISYNELYEIMRIIEKYNGLLLVHCEDGDAVLNNQKKLISEGKTQPRFHAISRPPETEAYAVEKVLEMAKGTQCMTYLVHISSSLSIDLIKKNNLPNVFVETCPQYLILNNNVYQNDDFETAKYVISPPLRSKLDNNILWNCLSENIVNSIGTDHCPFNLSGQKDKGKNDFTKIPNGAGGIEYRYSLLYTYGVLTGKISLQQWIALCSTNIAKIFELYDKKGKIKEGYNADIVIWNPLTDSIISLQNQYQRCDSNIYEGFKIKGNAETVIIKGKIVLDNGKFDLQNLKSNFLYHNNNL